MAYMNQEQKKLLTPGIKAVLKKYGLKGTIGVWNYMSLVVNIWSGNINFNENFCETFKNLHLKTLDYNPTYLQVNQYHLETQFSGTALACLKDLVEAMNIGNHDNSDIQIDYFDIGWYININIGNWDKPYKFIA